MRARILYLIFAILVTLALLVVFGVLDIKAQSPTCVNNDQLVIDTSTKTYKCITPGALPAGTGTTMIIANASSTGTTVNKFAKLTGAPSTAVIASNGDTENAIGIVTAGAGTTGNATITILGQVSCVFDGATTAGNYVTIAATGGGCHDAGSTYPTSGAAYGRVLSTNGGAGTYVMELMTPDIAFQNAGNGKSRPGTPANSVQVNVSSQFTGSSAFLYDTSTNVITLAQGTKTSSAPFIDHSVTWNSGGTTFTNLKSNITDTASANGSIYFDFQKGGVSQFKLQKIDASNNKLIFATAGDQIVFGGNSVLTGTSLQLELTSGNFKSANYLGGGSFYVGANSGTAGGLTLARDAGIYWESGTNVNTDPSNIDVSINRGGAAGKAGVWNGTGGTLGDDSNLRDWISRHYQTGIGDTPGNCKDSAGAAACGAATAGSVVIDAGATTVVVSTTQVTANSQIFVQYDSSLGTRLGVTCNTTVALPVITARTAATSFTITVPVAPVTNPACYSFFIVN